MEITACNKVENINIKQKNKIMTDEKNNNIFDESNEMPNNWVKWGKVGDKIQGTLVAVRTMQSRLPGQEGKKTQIYEVKADSGSYHDMDDKQNPIEPPIETRAGEYWNIGGKEMIDRQLRNVKIGTKIGLKFNEEVQSKTKGFNATKVIKVYVPKGKDGEPIMDDEWLTEQQEEGTFENL